MTAACRQILIDRIDNIDKLRRELEKDVTAPFLDEHFETAVEEALNGLDEASSALAVGLMKLDDATRALRPETPPMDPKVFR